VHIVDTGVGIAPIEIPRLFTKFGKLHRTASKNSEGIGLGLTIVNSIVQEANGSINIESDGVGQGSTFMFTIPMPVD